MTTFGDLVLKRTDFFTDETGTHPIRDGEGYSGEKAGDPKSLKGGDSKSEKAPEKVLNGHEGHPDYHTAHEAAQKYADSLGHYVRLRAEKDILSGGKQTYKWNMVPDPKNQYGRDLQGELVTPKDKPQVGDFPMGANKDGSKRSGVPTGY